MDEKLLRDIAVVVIALLLIFRPFPRKSKDEEP
jgi:hypothetical protein